MKLRITEQMLKIVLIIHFAHPVAKDVAWKVDYGIVICGSGNGIAMTVNKHPKVSWFVLDQRNCLLNVYITTQNIVSIPLVLPRYRKSRNCRNFFRNKFEGRHQNRVDKIALLKVSCLQHINLFCLAFFNTRLFFYNNNASTKVG
jgi:ribose 5-phosphate isomerase RpiB